MRIADHILRHAAATPHRVAVVCGSTTVTYEQLARRIEHEARTLALSTARGVAFSVMQTDEFVVKYFAIHLAGRVAAPLERDINPHTAGDIARRVAHYHYPFPSSIADVLFTTGTTGQQKGVMISHDTLIANAENEIAAMGFGPDTVFVICGPLGHIGCLSQLYTVMMAGGTVIITEGMKDVNAFYRAMDYPSHKMATFLVPANIRILLAMSRDRLASYAHKIDFIVTGAAPISQDDMQRLCQTLPSTRLFNTYASTETGIIATHDFNAGPCTPGCLGRAMKHSSFEIIDNKIVCRGRTLMSGYFDDPQLTASVLHGGAMYTHDIGHVDSWGRLHLVGRDDDVINVGGLKVTPAEVENQVMKIEGIADCICIATPHPIVGSALKLLYTTDSPDRVEPETIAQSLKSCLEAYKIPTQYQRVEKIERTFNGKLNRKYYKGGNA